MRLERGREAKHPGSHRLRRGTGTGRGGKIKTRRGRGRFVRRGVKPQFRDLQIAYKVLSNEKNRVIYTQSLSSTYDQLSGQYYDPVKGEHVALSYELTDRDFARGSEEEKLKKREDFMQKFEEQRNTKEKALMDSMKRHEVTGTLPVYSQILKKLETLPVAPCLQEKFDINKFNQLFEHNKQAQSTDIDHYMVDEPATTDLAPTDQQGIFTDEVLPDQHFQTYTISGPIKDTHYDSSRDVTRTQDIVYDDLEQTYQRRLAEQIHQRQMAEQNHQPKPIYHDDHPLSYQQII